MALLNYQRMHMAYHICIRDQLHHINHYIYVLKTLYHVNN